MIGFQNGAINAYVIHFGSIWGSLLEHFRTILRSFWEFWEGLPRYLQKASKKIEKNTSQAPSWGFLELKLELLGAKMAAKSAKMGQHDRQDDHFGIDLATSGSIWGAFWSHLGKQAEYWKTLKNLRFFIGFLRIGGSRRAVLEQLGAMLGHLGHLGATWPENGGQERQDEPKNRNCAFYCVFLALRCTECDRGRWKWTSETGVNTSAGVVGLIFGQSRGKAYKDYILKDWRIQIKILKDWRIGYWRTLGFKTRHWRLEGLMD